MLECITNYYPELEPQGFCLLISDSSVSNNVTRRCDGIGIMGGGSAGDGDTGGGGCSFC